MPIHLCIKIDMKIQLPIPIIIQDADFEQPKKLTFDVALNRDSQLSLNQAPYIWNF